MKIKIFLIDMLTGLFLLIQLYPPLFSFVPSEKIPMISTGLIMITGFVILFLQVPYGQFLEEWHEKKIDTQQYALRICSLFILRKEKYFLIDIAPAYFEESEIYSLTHMLYRMKGFSHRLTVRMQMVNIRRFQNNKQKFTVLANDISLQFPTNIIADLKSFCIMYGLHGDSLTHLVTEYTKLLQEKLGQEKAEVFLVELVRLLGEDQTFKKDEDKVRTEIIKRLNVHIDLIKKSMATA